MSGYSLDIGSARIVRTPRRTARAGLIGCGSFGAGILAQAGSVPSLEVPAVADHSIDAARQAYVRGGVPDEAILVCDSQSAALRALEAGKRVIVADPLLLMELPLDVIVEATGEPEAGARHAEAAIRHGRHVAMVNKEADVTVGPILHQMAEEAGVVYTAVDGDQHGLLMGLVAWARRLGLEVLCGGKSRDMEIRAEEGEAFQLAADPGVRVRTPALEGPQQLAARHERLGARSRIGNWDLVELVIAANATGLVPDLPSGVHCPALYVSEIPRVLCPTEMGGILRSRGVIDAVTCLRRPHEVGLGGGVFVVVTAATDAAREVLQRGADCSNDDGTATLITHPYHLLGLEAIDSILAAALLGIGTGAVEYRPRFDVAYRVTRDLEAGAVLGADHSPELEALIVPAAPLADDRPLPAHLASGNRLVGAVTQGTVITRAMIVPPADSAVWALRARQDAYFFPDLPSGGRR